MTDATYVKALGDLNAERDTLLAKREDIDRRLSQLDAAIENLRIVVYHDQQFEGGLSDACRIVLRRNLGRAMAPTEVRDGLRDIGYDTSQHSNVMASVHSVLKRLAESPYVEPLPSDDGTKYRWKTSRDIEAEKIKLRNALMHGVLIDQRIIRDSVDKQTADDSKRTRTHTLKALATLESLVGTPPPDAPKKK